MDIHKEMLFAVGSVCRVKKFTTGGEKHGKCFVDDEDVETEMRKCAETTVKKKTSMLPVSTHW
jgi:hypothetical protein